MKLLMRCEHTIAAAHYAGALRAAGIDCEVRNTALSGAIGEIPFLECAPQIWIRNSLDEARARELIADLRAPVSGRPWTCSACGEVLEPQFSQCWNCGAGRSDAGR
jgi:Putative prokaryotic signal transducing protein